MLEVKTNSNAKVAFISGLKNEARKSTIKFIIRNISAKEEPYQI